MKKNMLRKNLHARIKLRPMARRFYRDIELEQIDGDWRIVKVDNAGIIINNVRTSSNEIILGYDHIHQYTSDPGRDNDCLKHGILSLNVQICFDATWFRIEPITGKR